MGLLVPIDIAYTKGTLDFELEKYLRNLNLIYNSS